MVCEEGHVWYFSVLKCPVPVYKHGLKSTKFHEGHLQVYTAIALLENLGFLVVLNIPEVKNQGRYAATGKLRPE